MATTAPDDRVLGRVVKAVTRKQCILFLGAAVNAPPPDGSPFEYPAERRPPIGSQLSRQLAAECNFAATCPNESPDNLQRVALAYELDSSRSDLVDEIAYAVDEGRTPSPMLGALARLNFPIVITTNYDQLFERALRAAGKEPRVSVYHPGRVPTTTFPDAATCESPIVYKLHGDIGQRESLVITDEDYIQFVMRMRDKEPYDPIPLRLKTALTSYKMLFLGYSLMDYNLRLLLKTLRWTIDPANLPDMYSVDFHPDPLILKVWQDQRRYVTFLGENVWSFVPRLYEMVLGEELKP